MGKEIEEIEETAQEEQTEVESGTNHSPTLEELDQKIDLLEKKVEERNELGEEGKDAITPPPEEGELERTGNGTAKIVIGGCLIIGGVFALKKLQEEMGKTIPSTTIEGQMGQGVDNGNG